VTLHAPAQEFLAEVAGYFGSYFDGEYGYMLVLAQVEKTQKEFGPKLGMSSAQLDQSNYFYGEGDPNSPGSKILIQATQGAVKVRNAKNGVNAAFLARMLIVAVYQLWDEHYRAQFAQTVGKTTADIKSDLFGDLRRYRQSIVHNRSIAISDVTNNKVLKWFVPGELINPTGPHIQTLIGLIKDEIDLIGAVE
jgi:hypothetical protein